jgi:16S rRNA (cytosine1407-C5)-methyltransferase
MRCRWLAFRFLQTCRLPVASGLRIIPAAPAATATGTFITRDMNDSTPAPLPAEFLRRLRLIVGDHRFEAVLRSFSLARTTSFRVNTLKASPASLIPELTGDGVSPRPLAWCDHAFVVPPQLRSALVHSNAAADGRVYIQGLSSILATLVLDPRPGQWNLDLAAAPGGKATHMAALMNNQGKLSVVEPIRKRMFRLAENLKRAGVTISRTYLMDGRKAGSKVPERFDRVMLDAPCSSESRIRVADAASWKFWSPRKIREQSRKQAGLIISAFRALKPGGILLYSTCSFAPEENEAIVTHLLDHAAAQAEVLPIDLPLDHWQEGLNSFAGATFHPHVRQTRRILPNAMFDGFYLARIGKRP